MTKSDGLVAFGILLILFGGLLLYDGFRQMGSARDGQLGMYDSTEEAYDEGRDYAICGSMIVVSGIVIVAFGLYLIYYWPEREGANKPPQLPVYPPPHGSQVYPPPYTLPHPQQPMQPPIPQQAQPSSVESGMVMRCQSCGCTNLASAKACEECGAPLI